MNNIVIETRSLTRRFGQQLAVDKLDLAVPQGAAFAFLGPNGAGKTTTIKLLLNLLAPTSGLCAVLGTASNRLGQHHYARIRYVSESQQMP